MNAINTKRAISQLAETLTVVAANENVISISVKIRIIEPIMVIPLLWDIERNWVKSIPFSLI
jgi:hypothetical protein